MYHNENTNIMEPHGRGVPEAILEGCSPLTSPPSWGLRPQLGGLAPGKRHSRIIPSYPIIFENLDMFNLRSTAGEWHEFLHGNVGGVNNAYGIGRSVRGWF